MTRRPLSTSPLSWVVCLLLANCSSSPSAPETSVGESAQPLSFPLANASTDPQLFGFGYAQLALIDGSTLQGLAPPVRVQDTPWTTRWKSTMSLAPTVVVAGDFWHTADGKAYLLGIKGSQVTVFDPPEVPSTTAWAAKGAVQTLAGLPTGETIKDAAAGDFLGLNRDQLIVLTATHVLIYEAPATAGGTWTKRFDTTAPASNATGVVAGEFFSGTSNVEEERYRSKFVRGFDEAALYAQGIGRGPRGRDELCLLKSDGHLEFYTWSGTNWVLKRTDARVVSGKIASGDFLKRGRDAIAVVATGTTKKIDVYEAPIANGGSSQLIVSGTFDKLPSTIVDVTADRLFGYVDKSVDVNARRGTVPTSGVDVEIAFMERTPRYNSFRRNPGGVDSHYGWPLLNEPVTYTVYLKNNGTTTAAANSVTLKLWANQTQRNADIVGNTPTSTVTVSSAIAPFDPTKPFAQRYVTASVTFAWPYDLITENGNPWKKLNLGVVGERWTIASVNHASDINRRNDRAETALASWTNHPIFAGGALADRQANVGGDPASKEYQLRKQADALNVVWGRSHAGDKTGATNRVTFDKYDVITEWQADPTTLAQKESDAEDFWEGYRGDYGDGLMYVGGNWETGTYCTGEPDEMHETTHHFQGVDDLYQYVVEPSRTTLTLADGRVAQRFTYMSGNGEMANDCNLIDEGSTLIHQHVVGMRNMGHPGWFQLAPKKVYVKVLDRAGNPIPNAKISLWREYDSQVHASGTTDASGNWDTGHPYGEVPSYDAVYNEPHYVSPQALTGDGSSGPWIVVEVNGYSDAAMLGAPSDVGSGVLGANRHYDFGRLTLAAAYHQNPDTYTWTFRTGYAPSVSAFSKPVYTYVEGDKVAVQVQGTGTFRLYRQREPTYDRVLLAESSGSGSVTFTDSIGATDAFGNSPGRALYEVTEMTGTTESLPYPLALQRGDSIAGISDLGGGKLLVANHLSGATSSFLSLFQGPAPKREYVYNFRWGHRAKKAVKSALGAERYYLTLAAVDYPWESDLGGEHTFELVGPGPSPYEARGLVSYSDREFFSGTADNVTATGITAAGVDFAAQGVNLGDRLIVNEQEAVITSMSVGQLVAAAGGLPAGAGQHYGVRMHAGTPGTNLQMRQLQSNAGLDALRDATTNAEHVAIADPVAGRVVFWDSNTRYVTNYSASGFVPTGVAHHPLKTGEVLVLSRPSGANARLLDLKLQNGVVSLVSNFDLGTQVGQVALETGLAATASGTDTLVAITDGTNRRVLEYKLTSAGALSAVGTYTAALAPVISTTALTGPVDVTYSTVGSNRLLYASDGANRVVTLASTNVGTGGTGGTGGAGSGGASSGGTGAGGASSGGAGSGGASSGGASSGGTGAGGTSGSGGASGTGGSGGSSGLSVQYRAGDTNATDNQIKPYFNIVNTGTTTIPLSELKVRYWYTNEGGVAQTVNCDYAVMNCLNITRAVTAVSPVRSGADTYFELSFASAAGSLAPGAQSGEIQIRVNKNDWTNYNEANDYSFDPTKTAYAPFTKVTLYRNGLLIWGTEP